MIPDFRVCSFYLVLVMVLIRLIISANTRLLCAVSECGAGPLSEAQVPSKEAGGG